ncbi:sensor histidine kinase [Fulvivirga ligni]|uniref:sensor histidine kinase n=1 Tax=Fulvivirga ligni TaxID=2904246 RepID=UPI001F47D038|nr:HAMP domain-containing sensor histidine kinase [Fulvivirga ligni]UII20116.1 ATP-binding protein [Fulvivirga ligni]
MDNSKNGAKKFSYKKVPADFVKSLMELAENSTDERLKTLLDEHGEYLSSSLNGNDDYVDDLNEQLDNLKIEAGRLRKKNEIVSSDNFLLEHKKKELLKLMDQLEDAYEDIWRKNEELSKQKKKIEKQAALLKDANDTIIEKNEELKDQADYLYTANETISRMHEHAQKQKDELMQKHIELITLNNEKNSLIGIVAHDLKSPLSQITGLVSVIKIYGDQLDTDTVNYLNTIEFSASKLNDMVTRILDVESLESKNLSVRPKEIMLNELVASIAEPYKITAEEKAIELGYTISDGLEIETDEDLTNQILENLISNAIKFSPRRTKVELFLTSEGDHTLFEVRDQGPGISEEDQKKLFGKYQKLSARPTGNEISTGLGLSIVKKYADAVQAEIWCESELGKGASFFVKFPNKLSVD